MPETFTCIGPVGTMDNLASGRLCTKHWSMLALDKQARQAEISRGCKFAILEIRKIISHRLL